MSDFISRAAGQPILEDYTRCIVTSDNLAPQVVTLPKSDLFVGYNAYLVIGLDGAQETIYLRKGVLDALNSAAAKIADELAFFVFDAFRSARTQMALFNQILEQLRQLHPKLDEAALFEETRKYASYPNLARFPVPPHNTGGAIDIGLCNRKTRQLLNFGGAFDDPTEKSSTAFFERDFDAKFGLSESEWLEARRNRRVLFHLMTGAGFTNYDQEWWHYDLGDWVWAKKTGQRAVYDSIEDQVPQS